MKKKSKLSAFFGWLLGNEYNVSVGYAVNANNIEKATKKKYGKIADGFKVIDL